MVTGVFFLRQYDQLRPALVLGEDRNVNLPLLATLTRWLRPALVLGEDRNGQDPLNVLVVAGAAPDLGAGRGSQLTRSNTPPSTVTGAAPGLGAGRGSQHLHLPGFERPLTLLRPALVLGEDRNTARNAPPRSPSAGCARPWCWARIATSGHRLHPAGLWRLRPALVLGEDRNQAVRQDEFLPRVEAAPGLGAGRGSQLNLELATRRGDLRAAPGLGAGRGSQRFRRARRLRIGRRAAPGLGAGRGSQPLRPVIDRNSGERLRPALVLGEDRNINAFAWTYVAVRGCARPWCWARIATEVTIHRFATAKPAAPGLGAGRGSQPGDRLRVHQLHGPRLRPALVLGEDRNSYQSTDKVWHDVAAPGLGAGRGSQPSTPAPWTSACWLRPALVLGEDRNSRVTHSSAPNESCARPWCWARIATPAGNAGCQPATSSCARPWCWARIATPARRAG